MLPPLFQHKRLGADLGRDNDYETDALRGETRSPVKQVR